MRLLRSRHLSRSARFDNSPSNFIYKYYSRTDEFRSLTVDKGQCSMPDSSTPDAVCFQMAIRALDQLRLYWLHRYLTSSSSVKAHLSQAESKSGAPASITAVASADETSSQLMSHTEERRTELPLVRFMSGKMSYIKHNPHQYIRIQPTMTHPYHAESPLFAELEENTRPSTRIDSRNRSDSSIFDLDERSIDEYSTNDNLELFYRVLVSDSLAGWPFLDFLAQTKPTSDDRFLQPYIRCIADAEILLSITSDKLKERLTRQFIVRYLEVTSIEQLPAVLFDDDDQQRRELIEELLTEDNNHYLSLWKMLLNLVKVENVISRTFLWIGHCCFRFSFHILFNTCNSIAFVFFSR